MEIRPCTDADLDALTTRWKTPGGVHESHLLNQARGSTTYLVAWDGLEPLGSGVVRWDGAAAREAFPLAVEIAHLQVRAEHRGHGVGTAIINAAEGLIARAGKPQAAVGVADDNPDAERLYAKLGYRGTGITDVSNYSWVSDDGVVHQETEHDQLLIKDLD